MVEEFDSKNSLYFIQ